MTHANFLALAIQNAQSSQAAITDDLTGLLNISKILRMRLFYCFFFFFVEL